MSHKKAESYIDTVAYGRARYGYLLKYLPELKRFVAYPLFDLSEDCVTAVGEHFEKGTHSDIHQWIADHDDWVADLASAIESHFPGEVA